MEPYIGEIRIFAGTFAPRDWAFCNGALLPISQYAALFSLIGTSYGGNGTSNFALPNLQTLVPLGIGNLSGGETYALGQKGGKADVTITEATMPEHNHPFVVSKDDAITGAPNNAFLAATNGNNSTIQPPYPDVNLYIPSSAGSPNAQLDLAAVNQNASQDQAHNNRMPYLCINYIISLNGLFPSPE